MSVTPLLDRIEARKPRREPEPIAERMSPFMRKLREKRLPTKDYTRGAFVPRGSDDAA